MPQRGARRDVIKTLRYYARLLPNWAMIRENPSKVRLSRASLLTLHPRPKHIVSEMLE
jgi:hypothetical protein